MCVVECTNKTLVNGTVDDSEEFDLDLEKQAENRPEFLTITNYTAICR